MSYYYGWKPYVPMGVRRANAMRKMEKLSKKGLVAQPVKIEGRKIANSFWGQAWCDHLAKFSDYENRLPRGRSYVRNGLVCHLEIAEGKVKAMVCGSELYNVDIRIKNLPGEKWRGVKSRCAGQIGSLLELLKGRLSDHVMSVVTDRDKGLFPLPGEMKFDCDCPDWADMCKHVAAVLYGIGARLDAKPELLFVLRGVDHEELISAEVGIDAVTATGEKSRHKRIEAEHLAEVFGIEMSQDKAPLDAKLPARQGKPATRSVTHSRTKKKTRRAVHKEALRKTSRAKTE